MKRQDADASRIPRRLGRPLSFDRDVALYKAMLTFWRHGYETTAISDLTAAMGITTPSLYAAFGDKRRLFLEAAHLYAGSPDQTSSAIVEAPSAYDAARTLLIGAAIAFTGSETPKGCLLASATASGSAASADVQLAIAGIRQSIVDLLRSRIERDVANGLLPPEANASALAGLVMSVMQGFSTLARDGWSRASLTTIVDAVMRAWPKKNSAA